MHIVITNNTSAIPLFTIYYKSTWPGTYLKCTVRTTGVLEDTTQPSFFSERLKGQ